MNGRRVRLEIENPKTGVKHQCLLPPLTSQKTKCKRENNYRLWTTLVFSTSNGNNRCHLGVISGRNGLSGTSIKDPGMPRWLKQKRSPILEMLVATEDLPVTFFLLSPFAVEFISIKALLRFVSWDLE